MVIRLIQIIGIKFLRLLTPDKSQSDCVYAHAHTRTFLQHLTQLVSRFVRPVIFDMGSGIPTNVVTVSIVMHAINSQSCIFHFEC
jgi:hypothetical protein